MAITKETVLHVAKLARLELTEQEVVTLQRDLGKILEHVEELNQLDTAGVADTSHVAAERAPLRPDLVQGSLETERALSEAPRRAGGGFAVPAFVDE
jgi:aspartyl-tRNA(Asn)/glutamyl-tRNA(Gln) amidotransferase subunit C